MICLGKSTYARCGIIVNVTPLEPEWEGQVTHRIQQHHAAAGQDLRQRGRSASSCSCKGTSRAKPATPTRRANIWASGAPPCRECKAQWTGFEFAAAAPLSGEITVGGAKNAALPLMVAGMLTDERLIADQRAAPGRHPDHDAAAAAARHRGRAGHQRRPHPVARRRDHQHRGALRHRPQDARLVPGARPAAGARRRGARSRCPAAAPSAPARSTCT